MKWGVTVGRVGDSQSCWERRFPCVTFSVCFYPRKSTTNPTDTKVRFQVESKIITPPKMSLSLQCWKSRSVIIGEIKPANQLSPENGGVTAAADLTEESEPTDGTLPQRLGGLLQVGRRAFSLP